ncbi:UNVERIFIED_CONTAM: hypothetical protein Sangu_2712800 [Sesamum angustifolium]|uniref:Uncharacterized protein n=1 Tax=Sesamum angustifolium TaxID=2727405 RepID=A0AAW2J017_9LAMI
MWELNFSTDLSSGMLYQLQILSQWCSHQPAIIFAIRDREEYTEDSCNCAGGSGWWVGNGLFIVHKISFQEKNLYLQVWWIKDISAEVALD